MTDCGSETVASVVGSIADAMQCRPYPAYKDSGVEWLEKIPTHWEVKENRWLFRESDSRSEYGEEELLTVSHISGVTRRADKPDVTMMEAASHEGYKLCSSGDLAVNTMWAWMGALGVAREDGMVSPSYNVYRIVRTGLVPSYYDYLCRTPAYIVEITRHSKGIWSSRLRLYPDTFRNIQTPVPPRSEQRRITEFLDQTTANIEGLVAKKERLIELLQEKRTALITRAVTKGLDPDARMKDSGVEWLGEIPVHWEMKRLKYLLAEPLQYGANEAGDRVDHRLPRYIRITDIRDDGTLRDDSFRSLPEEIAKPYLLAEGDILFARSGATVGKTFRYDRSWGRAAYAGYLIRARPSERKVLSHYVSYFTQSRGYSVWLRNTFVQATIQNVSAERYASLRMPIPRFSEQRAIVSHLDCEMAKVDTVVARIRVVIDRLKELRTALISAAVTGKIDVRVAIP